MGMRAVFILLFCCFCFTQSGKSVLMTKSSCGKKPSRLDAKKGGMTIFPDINLRFRDLHAFLAQLQEMSEMPLAEWQKPSMAAPSRMWTYRAPQVPRGAACLPWCRPAGWLYVPPLEHGSLGSKGLTSRPAASPGRGFSFLRLRQYCTCNGLEIFWKWLEHYELMVDWYPVFLAGF